jgi:CubicO group peptidase (beta-lactamase class C family)
MCQNKADYFVFVVALLLAFVFVGSATGGSEDDQSPYVYKAPVQLHDGWEVSSLSAEGIEVGPVEEISSRIRDIDDIVRLYSMLIVKNGKLVHEVYSPYCQRNTLFWLASITKTVTSTLIGIAIDNGYITGVDAGLVDLLPEYADAVTDPGFDRIELEHVMTMSTGMDWFEHGSSYNDANNSEFIMVDTEDWIRYVLSRPLRDEPGEKFLYNTGGVHLLSAVIKSTTGLYANQFAEEHLLHPLGIYAYRWNRDSTGYPCTGGTDGGLGLRSRDLAKIGWLFLNNGNWNGRRIVSQEWIDVATRPHNSFPGGRQQYGYNWFSGSLWVAGEQYRYVAAFGYGGQTLYLIPDMDLVLVFNCSLSERGVNTLLLTMKVLAAASG